MVQLRVRSSRLGLFSHFQLPLPSVPQHPSTRNYVNCSICLNFCTDPKCLSAAQQLTWTSPSCPSRCCPTPQTLSGPDLVKPIRRCLTGFIRRLRNVQELHSARAAPHNSVPQTGGSLQNPSLVLTWTSRNTAAGLFGALVGGTLDVGEDLNQ